MLIAETFVGLQGEGPYAGFPALFIRTAGCVAPICEWCDTAFAQTPAGAMQLNTQTLLTYAREATKEFATPLVVITGGEPFAQGAELLELCQALLAADIRVQIETSGKVAFDDQAFVGVVVVCSPKWFDGQGFVVQPSALSSSYFKFVVGTEADVVNAVCFIEEKGIERNICSFMPKGQTRDEQLHMMPLVTEWCLKTGYTMSPRLHILSFDRKRGV